MKAEIKELLKMFLGWLLIFIVIALVVLALGAISANSQTRATANSYRYPSVAEIKKYCQKHPGESWEKRNWEGIVVAEGNCE